MSSIYKAVIVVGKIKFERLRDSLTRCGNEVVYFLFRVLKNYICT